MQLVGNIPGESEIVEQKLVPVPAIVDAARARAPGTSIHIVSNTFLNRDFNELIASELDGSLKLTVPLTFVILLIAFGAIVAALVPLILAATSLAAGYGLLGLYSQGVSPVSANAAQLLILMGLAVAVDYSLFMVTRFRSERQRGATRPGGDRDVQQHRRPRGVLLGHRGRDLARRPAHARDQPVHVDGRRHDGRRRGLRDRQPHVPARDDGDRRRSDQPRDARRRGCRGWVA